MFFVRETESYQKFSGTTVGGARARREPSEEKMRWNAESCPHPSSGCTFSVHPSWSQVCSSEPSATGHSC